jgi:FkbM family methyltransferase
VDASEKSKSQHGEDRLIATHFGGKRDGYFVEVGALDGVTYSNTYLLEMAYGWRGVLIEADPDQALRCAQARPGSVTFAKAATTPEMAGSPISLTVVEGADAHSAIMLSDRTGFIDSLRTAGADISTTRKTVHTATLDDMLIEASAPSEIDFLSMDIDGHELDAGDRRQRQRHENHGSTMSRHARGRPVNRDEASADGPSVTRDGTGDRNHQVASVWGVPPTYGLAT